MLVSRVLVVDGNRATRDALVTCLQFVGVEAHGVECAVGARFWLSSTDPDVIVVSCEASDDGVADLLPGGVNGEAESQVSLLVLTHDGRHVRLPSNYPIVELLHRPVAVSHVVERVESLIDQRRMSDHIRLNFGALSLDLATARAERGDRALRLGRIEARLLAFFMGVPDRVVTRAQVLHRLWPTNVRVEERTVDVHIRRLRTALEELGCAGYIQTVRGSGYRFSHMLD